MRRKDRELSPQETLAILEAGEYGILSLADSDGTPYGIPLSYALLDGRLWFHGAKEGRKAALLKPGTKAHFTVVGEARAAYTANFTTFFSSVMAEGTVSPAEGDEKRRALYAIAAKYLPDSMDHADHDIAASFERTAVWCFTPSSITGKAKRPAPRP